MSKKWKEANLNRLSLAGVLWCLGFSVTVYLHYGLGIEQAPEYFGYVALPVMALLVFFIPRWLGSWKMNETIEIVTLVASTVLVYGTCGYYA